MSATARLVEALTSTDVANLIIGVAIAVAWFQGHWQGRKRGRRDCDGSSGDD